MEEKGYKLPETFDHAFVGKTGRYSGRLVIAMPTPLYKQYPSGTGVQVFIKKIKGDKNE